MDMDINKQTNRPPMSVTSCLLSNSVTLPSPLLNTSHCGFRPPRWRSVADHMFPIMDLLLQEKTTCFLQAMFPLPPPATNCRPRTCCRDDNALLNTFLDDVRHTARPTTNDVKLVAPESGGSARRCFLSNSVRWSSRFTTVDTMSCHGR